MDERKRQVGAYEDAAGITGTRKPGKKVRALNSPADIYIINRENVVWLVDYYRNSWPFDMVVVDEEQQLQEPQGKKVQGAFQCGAAYNRLVELTGTPSPNGLDDLWAQLYLLDGGERSGRSIPSSGNGISNRTGAGQTG